MTRNRDIYGDERDVDQIESHLDRTLTKLGSAIAFIRALDTDASESWLKRHSERTAKDLRDQAERDRRADEVEAEAERLRQSAQKIRRGSR